jgi:eukaryotic-like serine/threonine-protein kinase
LPSFGRDDPTADGGASPRSPVTAEYPCPGLVDGPRRSSDPLPSEDNPVPFGRYQLVELVGEGAMAQVYRARQSGPMGFSKEVALKRLRQGALGRDRREIEALVNEARVGGQLRHPNLVEVYGCDVHDGAFFLAMEYIRGWLLDDVLWRVLESGEELPRGAVIDILRQIARGLAYAHEATNEIGEPLRLVHRDLKPQNIFLDRLGVVKIADFGLAKSTANLYRTTDTDETKGSPLYMSPEQIGGDSLDARSDLFALGSIATELVTGLRPFEGTSIPNTLMRVLEVDCEEAMAAVTHAAPELLPLIGRLLRRDPAERYQTARSLQKDLDALAGDESIGAHTRALASTVMAEDLSGLPDALRRDYERIRAALQHTGNVAVDPTAHLRGAPGRAWGESDVVIPPPPAVSPPPPPAPPLRVPSPAPPRPDLEGPTLVAERPPALAPERLSAEPPKPSEPPLPGPGFAAGPGAAPFRPRIRRKRRSSVRTLVLLSAILLGLALLLGWLLWEERIATDVASLDQTAPALSGPTQAESPTRAEMPTAGSRAAPVIEGPVVHVPRASVRLWQDLPVVVQVMEDGAWSGEVWYRAADATDGGWRRVQLADDGSGRFEISIPVTQELGSGLVYRIELHRPGRAEPVLAGSTAVPYHVSVVP